jgi:hypothetical protein
MAVTILPAMSESHSAQTSAPSGLAAAARFAAADLLTTLTTGAASTSSAEKAKVGVKSLTVTEGGPTWIEGGSTIAGGGATEIPGGSSTAIEGGPRASRFSFAMPPT